MAQVHHAPAAEGVVAEAPTFKVGDEWRFTGGTFPGVHRVVGSEGDYVITEFTGFTRCEGCRYFRDRNLTVHKVLDAKGEPWPEAVLGEQRLDFPLHVGREWTQNIELRGPGGRLQPFVNRFKVEAHEEVSVKAGKFKAFRITQFQENRATGGRGEGTSWWSPDVRWWVKVEAVREIGLGAPGRARGATRRDTELESYTLK